MTVISMYYNRDGVPISIFEWARLYEDTTYCRIARTTVTDAADPARVYDVSTVWLGLDHSFGFGGPPLIFETMVFGDGPRDLDCRRYTTTAAARAGHAEMVVVVATEFTDPVLLDVPDRLATHPDL